MKIDPLGTTFLASLVASDDCAGMAEWVSGQPVSPYPEWSKHTLTPLITTAIDNKAWKALDALLAFPSKKWVLERYSVTLHALASGHDQAVDALQRAGICKGPLGPFNSSLETPLTWAAARASESPFAARWLDSWLAQQWVWNEPAASAALAHAFDLPTDAEADAWLARCSQAGLDWSALASMEASLWLHRGIRKNYTSDDWRRAGMLLARHDIRWHLLVPEGAGYLRQPNQVQAFEQAALYLLLPVAAPSRSPRL